MVNASLASWMDVYGQFLFSQPDNSVDYQQYKTGSFVISNQRLFYTGQQYLVSAEAKLPHTTGSFGVDIRPYRKLRVLESWMTDRLHNNSSASAIQNPITTSAFLGSALATNYSQEQVDFMFDVTTKLMFRGGYRYVLG